MAFRVPIDCVTDVCVCFGTNDDLRHGRVLDESLRSSSARTSVQGRPAEGSRRNAARRSWISSRSFGHRDSGIVEYGIPERLDVRDLLVDGQCIETRRRIAQRLSHVMRLAWDVRSGNGAETRRPETEDVSSRSRSVVSP